MFTIILAVYSIGFGTLIAAIPCAVMWWFTKRFPIWIRLLMVTFLFSLICIPAGFSGHGIVIVPLGLCLPGAFLDWILGVNKGDFHDLITKNAALNWFPYIWGASYFVCMMIVGIVVGIRHLNKNNESDV